MKLLSLCVRKLLMVIWVVAGLGLISITKAVEQMRQRDTNERERSADDGDHNDS